jgi:hypothetical protein
MRMGSITTDIISDGLVFNMDAANRASTIPSSTTSVAFNTLDLTESGSFINDTNYDSSTVTPSFHFDGTGDMINVNEKFDFAQSTAKFSINCWSKIDNPLSNAPHMILSNNYTGDGIGILLWHDDRASQGLDRSLRFQLAIGSGTHVNVNNEPVITNTNWHNIIVTSDGTTIKVYFDGNQLSTTGTVPGTTSTTAAYTSTLIGASTLNDGANFWSGNIGPIHIYNRALSATEVLHNYNALKGRFE